MFQFGHVQLLCHSGKTVHYRFADDFRAAPPDMGRHANLRSAKDIPSQRANGLEPSTFSLEGRHASVLSDDSTNTYDSQSNHLAPSLARLLQLDGDFANLVASWPTLPTAIRAGIMAMIDAARKDAE